VKGTGGDLIRGTPDIYLEGLKKSVIDAISEIQTWHIANAGQMWYRFRQLKRLRVALDCC
jgi:hypothetical protein